MNSKDILLFDFRRTDLFKFVILQVLTIIFCIGELNAQANPINAFESLMGGNWVSDGDSIAGLQSKSISRFEWGLNGKIVKTKFYNRDPETLEFGLRNEGIRIYNKKDSTIHFYEFDKFGGVTSGIVLISGMDFHYEYKYNEGLMLRDTWKFIDNDTYELTVGVWVEGKWKKKYHEATLKRVFD